jgi:hypothetical protein
MTKAERLLIEASARAAAGRKYCCSPVRRVARLGHRGPSHEFDVFCKGVVVGGVTTSPLKTRGGNNNTGGCDRACSELLWLTLWPGNESRIHIMTDRALADWLHTRYKGAVFPFSVTIFHYDHESDSLARVGMLRAPNKPLKRMRRTRRIAYRQR